MDVQMSNTTKQKPMKALLKYRRMIPAAVVSASVTIQTKIFNNSNFTGAPAPPVDQATLKAQTDVLSAKIAAAAGGDRSAIAEKNQQKDVVVNLLEQLAHYVEANSKNDMTIFLSTGFTPKAATYKKTPPVSESIRKIEPGTISGEMELTLMRFRGAFSYVVQYAPVGAGGVPGLWTSKPVTAANRPVLITGLTPGMTYVFQARALTKAGYSDWSESVTRIAL
jgi:hypothetical protein